MAVHRVQKLVDPAGGHLLTKTDEQRWWYDAHMFFIVHLEVERGIVERDRRLSVAGGDARSC